MEINFNPDSVSQWYNIFSLLKRKKKKENKYTPQQGGWGGDWKLLGKMFRSDMLNCNSSFVKSLQSSAPMRWTFPTDILLEPPLQGLVLCSRKRETIAICEGFPLFLLDRPFVPTAKDLPFAFHLHQNKLLLHWSPLRASDLDTELPIVLSHSLLTCVSYASSNNYFSSSNNYFENNNVKCYSLHKPKKAASWQWLQLDNYPSFNPFSILSWAFYHSHFIGKILTISSSYFLQK